jgi:nucleotide-binding universal stress UspA family protein
MFLPRRILISTDFSEASRLAFPCAATLARQFDAVLVLVYVVPSHLPAEISQLGMLLEEERMIAEAGTKMPLFRQSAFAPDIRVDTVILHGGPAHEICVAAKEQGADLIVMSTHGHSGLKRFAVGSVTENVVRRAPCPVWVVGERTVSPPNR